MLTEEEFMCTSFVINKEKTLVGMFRETKGLFTSCMSYCCVNGV